MSKTTIKRKTATTKKDKVLSYIKNTKTGITAAYAKRAFGLGNLRATIADIREVVGYDKIKTGKTKTGVLTYTYKKNG